MEPSQLPYDEWIRDALRGVMRRALAHVSEEGLPGDHHFYITFKTGDTGVQLPPDLRARYPDEMTIVLQHKFWDLGVDDDGFDVTLKFFGVSRHLRVPFETVTGFVDPAINFAIQLQDQAEEAAKARREAASETTEAGGAAEREDRPAVENSQTGDVITLDSFRKNKT